MEKAVWRTVRTPGIRRAPDRQVHAIAQVAAGGGGLAGDGSRLAVSPDYGPKGNEFSGSVNWAQIDLGHDHLISPEERPNVAMARQETVLFIRDKEMDIMMKRLGSAMRCAPHH